MAFTPVEQKAHRMQLADHLETSVHRTMYDHGDYLTCALGYAAKAGIGGMEFVNLKPRLPTIYFPPFAADEVFGNGSHAKIFGLRIFGLRYVKHNETRDSVIKALREFETE